MKKERMTSQALKRTQELIKKYLIDSDSDSDLQRKAKQKQENLNSNDNQGRRALKKIYAGGGRYVEVLASEEEEWQNQMQKQDKRCTNLPQAVDSSKISEHVVVKMNPDCDEYVKQSWDDKNNEQLNEDKDQKQRQKIKQKVDNKNMRKRKLLCKREKPRNEQQKKQKIKVNRRQKVKQFDDTKKQRLGGYKKKIKSLKQKKGKKKDKMSNQVYNGILDHFT